MNHKTNYNDTGFTWACRQNNLKIVELLIKKDVDIN